MKRFLSFCLLCVYVLAGNAQPRFGTMPQGAPPVPAPRPAFVPPPVAAPSFGSGGWNSPPPVAAPVQNWTPPQNGAPHIAAPVFGGPTPWNAPIAVPQPFGQGQSFSPAPVVAAPVFVPPVVQPQVQRPAIDAPIPQAIYSPSIAPNLAQPLPSDRVTAPRLETPTSPQSIAPILSGPVVPRAPPQTGHTTAVKGGSPSTSLNTVFSQDSLSGRTPASSRFLSAPSNATADPQSTSALAQGFLKEVPGQTKNALIGTIEGINDGLANTAKAVVDLQVAGYSPSTYRQAYAEVKAVSTDPSVRQYYANTITTAAQNLVSGTTAAAQRWFQSTDAREPSRAIASATTQAVIGEVVAARAAALLKQAPISKEITLGFSIGDDLKAKGVLSWIKPKEGYYDVVTHGTPEVVSFRRVNPVTKNAEWVDLNHRDLANLIKSQSDYAGGSIRLLSCATGKCEQGFAKNLANKLGVPVMAPNDILTITSTGREIIGENNTGSWVLFMPGN